MSVEVRVATEEDLERWNGYVERSPQGTLCHEREALAIQADHSGATLHPLIGFTGQEPVGVFPVFELRKRILTTAFSPPPHLRVPYLGPAYLNLEKLKQRKRERRRRRFVEGCLEWIESTLGPRYTHLRVGTGVTDARAFKWDGFEVTPEYTYVVDLSVGEEELLGTFSSDARSNVRGADGEYEIAVGGDAEIRAIVDQVRHRYESQGIDFDVSPEFVLELADAADDGAVRPFTLSVDGEFVGGILALEYGGTTGRWMGGVRTDADVDLPTNDLLDWAVMCDGIERGLDAYDLIGADTPRINRYKAKFNPELRTYYVAERGSWGMRRLARLYSSVK